jgi:methionyl-tRNA formyltransferase
MRTVYMGTSAFAVEILKALAASPHRPQLVITPPDRPRGRGRKVSPPPAAEAARELGIELLQVPSVNGEEGLAAIESVKPDAIGVCEFGQLIKEPLLSDYLILNVHPSLLPRWRGAAPIERALMAGDRETGVTIFKIVAGLDSGPVALLSPPEPVQPQDTMGTLWPRLSKIGGALLVDALDRAEAGTLELTEQSEDGVTYAEKIDPAERRLSLQRPAGELERVVRALTPHVGTYLELEGGERLGVSSARAAEESFSPGELVRQDGRLLVGCGEGALELLEVRPPGKRTMAVPEFLRGHAVPARAEP